MARKAQRTASHWSAQKGGVLYASEERNIATVRVGDELVKAKALVGNAAKFDAVMAKRNVCVMPFIVPLHAARRAMAAADFSIHDHAPSHIGLTNPSRAPLSPRP